MVSNKGASESVVKAMYQCGECDIRFTGSVCPDCGNKKGNERIAADGLAQKDHRPKFVQPLHPLLDEFGQPLSEEDLINLQYNKMAQEEFQENMRASRLNMSEIRKLESEKKLTIKRAELERLKEGISDTYPVPHAAPQQSEMPTGPLFGVQSPQSQFLSQLMRMGDEDRATFIEQLSDADPNALQLLNAMVTPQNQSSMMGFNNPMGMFPGYFPPAVQQERQPVESPVVLMKEMFGLMKEMQPGTDNSSKDLVRELKEELKSIHNRIDNVMHESNGPGNKQDPILQYLKHIEDKVDAGQQQPTFIDQLRGIRTMVDDMKEMGLINQSNPGTPISDQMQLKKLEHDIDMEKKKFNLDQDSLVIQRDNQKTREQLVQQLFSRGLTKPGVEEPVGQNKQKLFNSPIQTYNACQVRYPTEVVDEIQTDTGSIREIRRIEDNPHEME